MMTERRLIEALADGAYHPGPELGAALGITRSAVCKALNRLAGQGLAIDSHPQRGYRLRQPVSPLNIDSLGSVLGAVGLDRTDIHLLDQTPSTNDWLRQRLRNPDGKPPGSPALCLAEWQTAGRGRRGRAWQSPPYQGLCLSLYWQSPQDPAELAGLSLALAVGVVRALETLGATGVRLKWPNDFQWQGAKLGGLLLELDAVSGGPCQLIIGLGLNLRLPDNVRAQIDQPVAALEQIPGVTTDRTRVCAAVVTGMLDVLRRYPQGGLAAHTKDWRRLDAMRDRRVSVSQDLSPSICGTARGIDPADGALLLETDEGIRRLHSGDLSLRAQKHDSSLRCRQQPA